MSESGETKSATLWERTREGVREQVRRDALRLFVANGFETTTAADIAAAAGISQRSFFRYFPTKEDVLVSGTIAFGEHVRDALLARPADEPIWTSLRASLDPLLDAMAKDRRQSLDMMRVIMSTASLRAYHFEKHLAWERQLIPVVRQRIDESDQDRALGAQTITHAALACLDVALATWVAQHGEPDLSDLLDATFRHVAAL